MIVQELARQDELVVPGFGAAFVIVVLVICGYNWVATPTLEPIVDRDEFFYSVAFHFKEPAVCDKIGRYAAGGMSQEPGYQVACERSRCDYDLAQSMNDLRLCDKVKPLSFETQDGSRFSAEACRNRTPDPRGHAVAYLRPEDLVRTMESVGIDQMALKFRREQHRDQSAYWDLYEQVRQDRDFVTSLRALPEERTFFQGIVRPATGVEYLVSMIAGDVGDEQLCRKISAGAAYQFPDGGTYSLRSRCAMRVAFYTRKYGLCGYMPPFSRSDYSLYSKYDSQELCEESLKSEQYPDWGEPADAKPVYFASREAFQATLDELGYSGSGKPEMDPKPTFSDYIEFLFYVADHGSPELRAEYLRRVKKLPTATTADRSK